MQQMPLRSAKRRSTLKRVSYLYSMSYIMTLVLMNGYAVVPKRVVRARKDGHVPARDEDEEMLLLDTMSQDRQSPSRSKIRSRSQVAGAATASPQRSQRATQKPGNDSSETEPESDDEPTMPTTPRSPSPEYGSGRAPGRIVGSIQPLKDFKNNLKRGDVVSKAVEDLCAVIKEIVVKPFASRRTDEMIECMQYLRGIVLDVSISDVF